MQQELEILREIGRVSAYHGSNALSDFLGNEIILSPSSAELISTYKIPHIDIDKVSVAIFSRLRQGLRGEVAFILDERNAFKLIDLSKMKGGEDRELGVLTEMGVSIIKEIGNIVIGSYITALSLTLKKMIVPPLPTFLSGSLEHIFLDFIFAPYAKVEQPEKTSKDIFALYFPAIRSKK